MIDREYGKYYAVCDECGETKGPFLSWEDAKDYMVNHGWKLQFDKSLGEWVHTCEDCK